MEKKKYIYDMSEKNRLILITNDDGYNSYGIQVLKRINTLFSNNIWVFAPKHNQSAKAHSITINRDIDLIKLNNKNYVIEGTPADCVIIGLEKIKSDKKYCNLLISGINEGVNLGYDLIYSGTVAAAREGCLNGVQSIAMSIDTSNGRIEWSGLEYFAPKIIQVGKA